MMTQGSRPSPSAKSMTSRPLASVRAKSIFFDTAHAPALDPSRPPNELSRQRRIPRPLVLVPANHHHASVTDHVVNLTERGRVRFQFADRRRFPQMRTSVCYLRASASSAESVLRLLP